MRSTETPCCRPRKHACEGCATRVRAVWCSACEASHVYVCVLMCARMRSSGLARACLCMLTRPRHDIRRWSSAECSRKQPHKRGGPNPFPLGVCFARHSSGPAPSRLGRVRIHRQGRCRQNGPKGPPLVCYPSETTSNDARRCRPTNADAVIVLRLRITRGRADVFRRADQRAEKRAQTRQRLWART